VEEDPGDRPGGAVRSASYEICVAAGKATALLHLLLESPDWALLDISDDVDGIEICRELRARSGLNARTTPGAGYPLVVDR
jgi:DNA-binding response OmpR family regulator